MNRRLFPWLVLFVSAGCQQQQWTPLAETPAQSGVTDLPPKENAASLEIPVQDAITDRLAGKVIRVIDGDTLVLLVDREQGKPEEVRVRLEGIDCPESGQPWSKRAKQELSDLVLNQMVKVWTIGEDRYERKLGRVYVGADDKPTDVNAALVARGLAWHYKQYSEDENLAEAEKAARRERKGLWVDPSPVAPWDWREQQRGGKSTPAASTTAEAAGGYWLNTSSDKIGKFDPDSTPLPGANCWIPAQGDTLIGPDAQRQRHACARAREPLDCCVGRQKTDHDPTFGSLHRGLGRPRQVYWRLSGARQGRSSPGRNRAGVVALPTEAER